jgi:hypothetical protein
MQTEKRIFFVGLGEVGGAIFDLFARVPGKHHFLIAGRNIEKLKPRAHLSLYAAMQLGYFPTITFAQLDLWNVGQTAEMLAQFRPDIIFCAATLQRWGAINILPKDIADRLWQAQIGPWLPLHLAVVYKLMQAVRQSGLLGTAKVLNATYPDVAHPVLHKVGLAPTTGIGDLANNVPALRLSISQKLEVPVQNIELRFVAQHHVSYWMSRRGDSGGAPYHIAVLVNGKDCTPQLKKSTLFDQLPGSLKRATGNQMTAASAALVFDGIINDRGSLAHAPGPNGFPGGYPIRASAAGVQMALPDTISEEEAISINTTAQQFDGIERIDTDGTVHFAQANMAILQQVLGYSCQSMKLSEVEERAKELRAKCVELAKQHGVTL